jgi:hypothetical protein
MNREAYSAGTVFPPCSQVTIVPVRRTGAAADERNLMRGIGT